MNSSREANNANSGIVILVGGSVRAAAQDAKRAGYRVIAVDRFGDRDLLDICDQWIQYDDESDWVKQLDAYRLAPIVPVGGFEWPASNDETRHDSRIGHRLVAYPNESALNALASPARLGKLANDCDLLFPETKAIHSPDASIDYLPNRTLLRQMKSHLSSSWLVKPMNHAGGLGIRSANDLTKKGVETTHYLQRRLRGFPVGANFIAFPSPAGIDVHLLGTFRGITYRRNPNHPFLYGGSCGPLMLSETTAGKLHRLGQRIASEFLIRGLFNVDLIMRANGEFALLEVNPRYSASMELLTLGMLEDHEKPSAPSLIQWHLDSYNQTTAPESRTPVGWKDFLRERESWQQGDRARCKRIVYCDPAAPAIAWSRFESNLQRLQSATYSNATVRICDVPNGPQGIIPGAPLCTVLVNATGHLRDALRTSMHAARLSGT